MKIITKLKTYMTKTKHDTHNDKTASEERVARFKKHLKIENPLWFKHIGYDTHVAIKTYLEKYESVEQISKEEREEFVDALVNVNKKFGNDGE